MRSLEDQVQQFSKPNDFEVLPQSHPSKWPRCLVLMREFDEAAESRGEKSFVERMKDALCSDVYDGTGKYPFQCLEDVTARIHVRAR